MTNLKRIAGGVSFVLILILAAGAVKAESLDKKFYVGLGTGYYFPGDQEGGGFRTSRSGENAVGLNRGLIWHGVLGYGFPLPPPKEGGRRRIGLTLELDVRYFDQTIGDETVFLDPDASTIQHIPIPLPIFSNTPARTYDETTDTRKLGRLRMIPVLADAVMRFGVQKKTTAFAGGVSGGSSRNSADPVRTRT